jgi:hypothetical protein
MSQDQALPQPKHHGAENRRFPPRSACRQTIFLALLMYRESARKGLTLECRYDEEQGSLVPEQLVSGSRMIKRPDGSWPFRSSQARHDHARLAVFVRASHSSRLGAKARSRLAFAFEAPPFWTIIAVTRSGCVTANRKPTDAPMSERYSA